jgi:transposase-like protein
VGSASPSYKGHRYPVEVNSHCVWLYFRFPLSFREVEELMLQRGVRSAGAAQRFLSAFSAFPRTLGPTVTS